MTKEDYIAKYGEKEGLGRWKKNERNKQYNQEHREEQLKYKKRYRQTHREEKAEYMKQYMKHWNQTPYGRAHRLIGKYRQSDRQYNRGDCTLTTQWIVNNIFTRRCLYCGEEDWRKLGTDRIDNSKPHTPNNVVCCCGKCNEKRHLKDFLTFAYSMGAKDSEGLIIQF